MESAITRRSIIKMGAAATAALASGGALSVLAGCAAKSTEGNVQNAAPAAAETQLTVRDGKWFADASAETKAGIAFSNAKLGIIPSGDGETLSVAYRDGDGVKQAVRLAPASIPVRICGDAEMLTVDDTLFRSVVIVDEKATIDALSLGCIDRAEIEGDVASLIVVGKADADIRPTSAVQSVFMGDGCSDVRIASGAIVGEVYAPYLGQVEFESTPCSVHLIDPDSAAKTNRVFVKVMEGHGTEEEREIVRELSADLQLPPVIAETAGEESAGASERSAADGSPSEATAASGDESAGAAASALGASAASASAVAFPALLGARRAWADEGSPGDSEDADAQAPEITEEDEAWGRLEDFQADPDAPIDEDCIELPPDEQTDAANDIPFVQGDIDTILRGVANLTLNKAVAYAANTLLSVAFGSNNGVERALNEISQRLDDIETEIQAVYSAIKEAELCTTINELITTYFRNTTILVDYIEFFNEDYMKGYQEGTDEFIAARKRVAMYLATATSSNKPKLTVGGQNVVAYAIDYCSALITDRTGIAMTHLEAYFQLCLLKSPWEHKTIEGRMSFMDEVANKFGLLCGYAAFALRGYMDYLAEDATLSDEEKKVELSQCVGCWEQLFGTESANGLAEDYQVSNEFAMVRETMDNASSKEIGYAERASRLIESYTVTPHDKTKRHFMVPGKEVTLMAQAAVLKVNKSTGASQPQLYASSDAHHVASIDNLRKIYDYYGGKKTLHKILFSEDEAGIALPDAGKKEDYDFSIVGVEPKADRYIKSKGSIEHSRYYTPVVSGKMKLSQRNYYNFDNNRGSKNEKYYNLTLLGVYEKYDFEK